ncbi:hypothetical protein ACI797_25365 [Geodermatophilus sp. SYSU D00691]
MAGEHVTGWEQRGGEDLAHAVRRSDADGAPPWTAVCGARIGLVRGAWTPGEGRSVPPCPRCTELIADPPA